MNKLFVAASVITAALGETAVAQAQCPQGAKVIDIRGTADRNERRAQRELIKACLSIPNTTVRLGPDVDLDFSDLPTSWFPIRFGSHASLISVAAFEPVILARATMSSVMVIPRAEGSARTPHSRGPRLQYHYPAVHDHRPPTCSPSSGPTLPCFPPRPPDISSFIDISCLPGIQDSEGSRVSGFQLEGPDQGQQIRGGIGIKIDACSDVEVSNMEISGWGDAAIQVGNSATDASPEPIPYRVLIHDNFLHNNQHPEHDGHALGYGVDAGGWSHIYQNVFDNNKHAVTRGGEPGGYKAEHNLVLKGGGHEDAWYEKYVHIFDVHGTKDCFPASKNCGDAGTYFLFSENAFQYKKEIDIKIRGKPRQGPPNPPTLIAGNVFARSDEQRAIDLNVPGNVSVVNSGVGANVYNVDTYGDYGVCDFDGDGVDDLFLATGVSWWFSSAGQFQWTHLNNQKLRRNDVRLGYFDADGRCDVLHEGFIPGQWFISSGGAGNWTLLGNFGHPLKDIQFGRFGEGVRDHRPNVTRQTTHAFWRQSDGQWFVTPLSNPNGTPVSNPSWKPVASSSFPLNQLRFGDFNGDGITDVLAVVDGHWAISESATGAWRRLNYGVGDPVQNIIIANMDGDDNIDDILRLDSTATLADQGSTVRVQATWWRSKNGAEPWKVWKTYSFSYPKNDADFVSPGYSFAGRFAAAHNGATMITDSTRMGQFHSESQDWTSIFPY